MAKFWVNDDADGDWDGTNNWSTISGGAGGAATPTSSDSVIFDTGNTDTCTLSANANCASITCSSNGAQTLDMATFDLHVFGDFILGSDDTNHFSEVDMGTGICTVDGDWTEGTSGNGSVTLTRASSTLKMTGTSKTIKTRYFSYQFTSVEIASGATISISSGYSPELKVHANLAVNGTLTISNGNQIVLNGNGGSIDVGASGLLAAAGNGYLSVAQAQNIGNGISSNSGEISCTVSMSFYRGTFASGKYSGAVTLQGAAAANQLTLTLGTYDFDGDVSITSGAASSTIWNIGSVAVDYDFSGDISVDQSSSPLTWNKGTGSITFSGTADQLIDFDGETVEDITIDKTSGKVTLTGDGSTDSVTCTDGELDIDGNNLTTVSSGNFTVAANFTLSDTSGGGLVTVAGNLDINGTSGNTVTWNGPDLDVTGTADADFTVVTNSDASAGTEVDATDNCTDSGGNTNWNIAAAGMLNRFGTMQGGIDRNLVTAGMTGGMRG